MLSKSKQFSKTKNVICTIRLISKYDYIKHQQSTMEHQINSNIDFLNLDKQTIMIGVLKEIWKVNPKDLKTFVGRGGTTMDLEDEGGQTSWNALSVPYIQGNFQWNTQKNQSYNPGSWFHPCL